LNSADRRADKNRSARLRQYGAACYARGVQHLTDLADQAVILPLALVAALAFTAVGWRRGAAAWALSVAFVLAATLAAKLLCAACVGTHDGAWPRSPSGHMAAALVVYGGLLAVLWPAHWRAGAALVGAAIGLSRLALGVHTVPDVAAGAAIGALGLLAFARLAGPVPRRVDRRWVGAAVGVCLALTYGRHLRAEDAIRDAAGRAVWPLSLCRPAADQARPYVSSMRTMSSSPR
jgi:membrane-associated phospholipid phosphatase